MHRDKGKVRAEKAAGQVPVRKVSMRRQPIRAQNSDRPGKPRTETMRRTENVKVE